MDRELVLIVDDDKDIRDLLEIYMKNEGYRVIQVEDGLKAFQILKNEKIDLIILDVMLPDLNGIRICSEIRKQSDIPILMLSAKGESSDKILGIMTGADDYVSKPFNPLEVVVRVKALLRRFSKNDQLPKDNEIIVNDLVVNTKTHHVTLNGQERVLTNKEFEILKLLASHPGIVFSSRKIYENVWNEDFFEADSIIMTHIKNLREKLGDSVKNSRYIKTIWGVGYRIDKS